MADIETARDLADKMSRNEYVSRWDVYYNRKAIRGLIESPGSKYPEIVETLLDEYIESVLETI
jgi:hypothetical protein